MDDVSIPQAQNYYRVTWKTIEGARSVTMYTNLPNAEDVLRLAKSNPGGIARIVESVEVTDTTEVWTLL